MSLRSFLTNQRERIEKNSKLRTFLPLFSALDHFLYEPSFTTKNGPHIRDAIDLKRWMIIVIFALLPCIIMAIWNTGLQQVVYASNDPSLLQEYMASTGSIKGYFSFCFEKGRYWSFLKEGCYIFLPIVFISYAVGGFWEVLFACVRKHEIAEGFLVSGMLYPLILPPSIPYWMVAVGVSAGVIIGKEVFGGTGMNILNPALTCRCFLYFAFPAYMTGQIWIGSDPTTINQNIIQINREAHLAGIDAYTGDSMLGIYNMSQDIKRIHVDVIASKKLKRPSQTEPVIQAQFEKWKTFQSEKLSYHDITDNQLKQFVTDNYQKGGLGLNPDNYVPAQRFANLKYGIGDLSDGNLFLGNMIGSMGEVSKLACLFGAFFLIITGVGSWRTMVAVTIGALATALLFEYGSHFGTAQGAWNPAIFDFPAYKHFLLGGLAFGLVYMATDPVSSPSMHTAKWAYGILIGVLIVVIRTINPAYPEGVMLAILFGNVFAPLFDYHAVRYYRRPSRVRQLR